MTKTFESAVNIDINVKDADKITDSKKGLNELDQEAKRVKFGMDNAAKSVGVFSTATGGLKQTLNGVGSNFKTLTSDIQSSNSVMGTATQEFEDLGDAVAKTQRNVEALALQYGINDDRTKEAIRVAGAYKGQLEQLDFAIDSNKGGTDQLVRGVQGLTAGFEIAAGTMALLGSESENLTKLLLKVQGAMALAQGLKDLKEYGGAIKALVSSVGEKLVGAFSTLRGALISSGIGAAIVGVGLLINEFVKLKEATEGASEEQKTYNQQLEDLRNERELLLKGEYEYTKEELENVESRLAAAENELKEKEELRAEHLRGHKQMGIEEDSVTKKRNEDQLKALRLNKERLLNEQIKLEKKVTDFELASIDKQIAEYEASENEKIRLKKIKSAEKQKVDDEEFETWLAQQVANEEYRKKVEDEEFETWLAQEIANYDYRQQLIKENADFEVQTEAEKQEQLLKYYDEEMARLQAVEQAKQAIFHNSVALANAIVNLAGQQSKAGKALALATIAANTGMAISNAITNASNPTPANLATNGLYGIGVYIGLAASILQNAKQARDIAMGKGTGGNLAPSSNVPRQSAPLEPRTFRASAIPEEGFNRDYKVYVLEGEITRTQKRVRDIESVSVVE